MRPSRAGLSLAFDRVIAADRPVIGAIPIPGEAGQRIDFTIIWRPRIVEPAPGGDPWTYADDVLWFAAPGVGTFRLFLTGMEVTPFRNADLDHVDELLIATALPAALWMQGAFLLHAAVVVPRGRGAALAIAGRSGAGKSRLARSFLDIGAALVADDSIAVILETANPVCSGLARGYHLGEAGGQARSFHAVPPDRSLRSAPLGAVVMLDDGPRASHHALTTIDAVELLLANRHRPVAPDRCGLTPRSLRQAASLAQTLRVYRWPRHEAALLLDDAVLRLVLAQ